MVHKQRTPVSRFSTLIDEVADEKNHSLNDVLMKAKVLAHSLRSRRFRQWIDAELNGYEHGELPPYRVVAASLYGLFCGHFNSIVSNVLISTSMFDADISESLNTQRIDDSIASIAQVVEESGEIGMHLDIRMVNFLRKYGVRIEGHILNEVTKKISKNAIVSVLSAVRTRLLDFLLELRDKYPELDTNDSAISDISSTDVDAAFDRRVYHYHDCTVFEGNQMRDSYNAGQAGAMGPEAKAQNINFYQVLREAIGNGSLADLAIELEQVRTKMLTESKNSEQDQSVAAVAEAEAAAKRGDAGSVLSCLRHAGKWALDQAVSVGAAIAVKVIEKSLDLDA